MPNEDEKREPAPPDEGADRDDRRLRDRLEGLVPDLIRKTFYAGLGAVFSTEEGIRKLANDFSLPKDVAGYLLSSAQGTKDEVLRILGREMHEFFSKLNLHQELAKLLTQVSFEIKTEIRFIPNDQAVDGQLGVKPDIKRKVSLRRAGASGEKADKAANGGRREHDEDAPPETEPPEED
jgi:uncharacterized Fe-S cluster-containing radical SAM superfamily protein